ncbi:endo-1,3-1,4-beta-glycanase ExoK [Rhizobium sp. BE258]|nr:family 16 glycosylhydrolase [Rhizobium sp. BE258]MDR7145339.1 endo-1,3-1,4-beta-glycanase ExoK [Rhizobium sp. BE258]
MCFDLSFWNQWSAKKWMALAAATACAALAAASPATADSTTPGDGHQATGSSFFEDFDSVDANFWYISDGWTNGPHQNCTWSQSMISTKAGLLTLRLEENEQSKAFLCGEIQTRQAFGHGTYEARLKSATGSGLNSAFFSFIGPADQQEHDEIDFEVLGKDLGAVQVNQYVKAKGGNEKLVALNAPADQDFNDFAFIWETDRLRYFVNGNLVQDVTDKAVIPTARQKIFLSLWGTDTLTNWMGPFSYSGPASMQVDWIAFTAAGQRCLFKASITCNDAIATRTSDEVKEGQ